MVFQNIETCNLTSSWVDGGGTGAKWLLISLGLSDWSSLSFIPVFSIILICNPWHTIFLMCEYVVPSFTVKTDHRPLFCWSISCSYKILKCLWVMYQTSITEPAAIAQLVEPRVWGSGDCGFEPWPSPTKDFKVDIGGFPPQG